jgi:hypothetical protein
MTTQHQIIAICIIAVIAVPLGTFTAFKTINKLMRPPVNTLVRSGDIELDYIEPTRPGYSYQPIDWVNYEPYNWSDRVPTYYSGQPAPSYFSGGNPPSFNSGNGFYINSCLENENIFNSYFTFLIFIILILTIIFWKINSLYSMALLIPFSTFDIDFRDSFEWKFNSWKVKPKISYLKIQSLTKDINSLLLSLVDDENYSMSLSFISSYKEWNSNKENIHPLLIDDAIIINKESDSLLITQFIMENLDKKGLFITDWLFKDSSINTMDPVILIVTVGIKVKI